MSEIAAYAFWFLAGLLVGVSLLSHMSVRMINQSTAQLRLARRYLRKATKLYEALDV